MINVITDISMKLALTILTALSALLFIVFYGKIIISAFKHHVITGLISFVPGLNLIILPSIWDKIGRAFIISTISLAVAFATWHTGTYNYLKQNKLIPNQQITQDTTEETEQQALAEPDNNENQSIAEIAPLSDDIKEISLPKKPLHYLVFIDTAKEKYSKSSNNDLRITLADNSIIEGRSAETTAESISIERYAQPEQDTSRIQKIKIANIKSLQTLSIQ